MTSPHLDRATDWRIIDRAMSAEDSPVHVGTVVHVNGACANIHLHPEEPILVRTNGRALRSETLLRLTVHEDDVTYSERDGDVAPDTLGGVPILVPTSRSEFSWCEVLSADPLPVMPNGSFFPRGDGDGAAMMSTRWVRLHVQARSIAFDFES